VENEVAPVLAMFDGAELHAVTAPQVLAGASDQVWAGGRFQALALQMAKPVVPASIDGIRLDNHWTRLAFRENKTIT
jgi:hypothetical protein